jgi:hypothetical protein
MNRELVARVGRVVGVLVAFAALFSTLPIAPFVKAQLADNHYLGPVAGSVGMLASFVAFLALLGALVGPPVLLWHLHRAQEERAEEPLPPPPPQQVTYGYQTPVPR